MTKQFLDYIYLKADSASYAANLITTVAYRFGYRVVQGQLSNKKPQPKASKDCILRWDLGGGYAPHVKYLKKRLSRLTAKTNPVKKVVIGMDDLRKDKIGFIYECKLIDEKGERWIECNPIGVADAQEKLTP